MKIFSIITFFSIAFLTQAQQLPGGLRGSASQPLVDSSSTVSSALNQKTTATAQTANIDVSAIEQVQNKSVLITIEYGRQFQAQQYTFELIEHSVNGWNKIRSWGTFPPSGYAAVRKDDLKAGHRYEFFMKPQVPESTQKEAGNVKIDILDIAHLQHLPGVESLIQKANPVYAFEESVSELVEAGADITFTFSL
ncbi:expressed unknown protein [Seminavis robusta]|uniref:Uncharacterized protein n=1 Tax=Seminavis robusta TaxID=568900 RepID=A0A9N8HN00_9STRA|nr:expressed unknown protein [Seminavis robusta]|eukprot:Sro945_g223080.1 n/a (194) ;mRNA; r:7182-7866